MKLIPYGRRAVLAVGMLWLATATGCKPEALPREQTTRMVGATEEETVAKPEQEARETAAAEQLGIAATASGTPAADSKPGTKAATATFGTGCFWCTEAVFETLKGVQSVDVGYMGGTTPNPTYKDVCTGRTGHAEVARITYDPGAISYEDLLDVFWKVHDPTSLNRQGADAGTQYRSAIFYDSDAQKAAAEKAIRKLQEAYSAPIVTEVTPATTFYGAEDYHQDYFKNNPNAPYCRMIIAPKLKKLKHADNREP